MSLSKQSRTALEECLYDNRKDCMFGDGIERDYIMDGVIIVGLNDMSDSELIEEYEEFGVDNDNDIDLLRWKAEMIMGKLGLLDEETT